MYATLATCYLCLKDEKNYQKYEAEFLANTTIEWEIETYKNTIADTKKILMITIEWFLIRCDTLLCKIYGTAHKH